MSRLLLGLLLMLACLAPRSVAAQGRLDVASDLRGVDLRAHVALHVDANSTLRIEKIAGAPFAQRLDQKGIGGFVDASYWLRIVVKNSGATKRSWLLELGYPVLDYVTLYVPEGAGYRARETGDMLPFSTRDFAYRNFVFMLEETPHSERTYYLRVKTESSMTLPLAAWTTKEFIEHQHLDWAVLCMFYGVVLVMALYNAVLYLFARQREHLFFALSVLSFALAQAAFVGHTFQFLLPDSPGLAQRALPVSIALCFVCEVLFGRYLQPDDELPDWYKRICNWDLAVAFVCLTVSLFAPYRFSVQLVIAGFAIFNLMALGMLLRLFLQVPSMRLAVIAWLCICGGAIAFGLRAWGVLPTNVLTLWSPQIGAALQVLFASVHLANRLNTLRANVSVANEELSGKVSFLEDAVARATEATERAEQAARVKDEFMATMSHELRTPLNAIINLPPGLLRDFPELHFAHCDACGQTFELEEHEAPDAPHTCPDCPGLHLMKVDEVVRYRGTPEHTLRYLEKIERSGFHLLQVVNGILDAEQVKSGQLALTFGDADIGELTREVVEEMSDLAERGGVQLVVTRAPDGARTQVDRLRLRQVLINLISNAIKFSDRKGTVSVFVDAVSDGFRFAVKDEGIGIAPENLENVFGSFEQVHKPEQRRFGGTGLGLFISRSLVRKHGGEMWVDSKLGQGATFRFHIPKRERARSTANLRDSQVFIIPTTRTNA